MICRMLLAAAGVTFGLSATALVRAGPSGHPHARSSWTDRAYLNPMGVAVSQDGRRAYVALSGVRAVAEVDLVTGQVLRRFPTDEHPTELFRDGSSILVADDHHEYLRIDTATGETRRGGVSRMADGSMRRRAAIEIPLTKPAESVGVHVHTEPDWAKFRGRIVGGGGLGALGGVSDQVFSNALGVEFPYQSSTPVAPGASNSGALGFAGGGFQLTGSLDTDRSGAADPSDAVWSAPAAYLFVAAAGSDAVLALKTKPVQATAREVLQSPAEPSDFGGWGGLRTRVVQMHNRTPLVLRTQSNPRRLAMSDDGRTLVASNVLSDSLTVIAVDGPTPRVVKHLSLRGPPADAARRGEILFHSSRLTFNGRFTCASCHPGGGSDGRVWDTPSEDPGPRRTKPLFGVRDTAPYGWHGDSVTLADRVRKTLGKLHRFTPSPAQVDDLVAYLASLPPPKPKFVPDDARESLERGRELFEGQARCAKCHVGDSLQDGDLHDVGLGGSFRTPSLRGVADRHRLLHNGRAWQVEDVFQQANEQKRHGAAHTLSKEEFADLMTYVKSR